MKHFSFSALTLVILAIAGCVGKAPVAVAPAVAPAAPAPAAPEPPLTAVFMGDSITYNWGQPWASPDFAEYPQWTDQGIIGNDSGEMVDRFQADVIDRHPDVVVILAGTNDVYPGWQLCDGTGTGYHGHNWDTCHNIAWMVTAAKLNGIKPVLATIPPWNCSDATLCALAENADPSPQRYTRISQLNGWIKAYGSQQGIPVADYWSVLVSSDQQTYIPALTLDGVHPSPAGYALMTPLAQKAIAQAPQAATAQ
jgi:acyl-CoA thioesterase I